MVTDNPTITGSEAETLRAQLAIRSIENWLGTKHVVSWGEAYDISDPGRRRAAAKWLWGEMQGWMEKGAVNDA